MAPDIRTEIKQSRPFSCAEQEAHVCIERTAAVLGHALSERLKPHGITPTQYNVLRILRGAGRDGLCRNEVRERLVSLVPDVTRLLDRMEESKLVARKRDSEDRRYVTTRITQKGLKLLEELDAPCLEEHRRCLSQLSEEELKTLISLLNRARDGA